MREYGGHSSGGGLLYSSAVCTSKECSSLCYTERERARLSQFYSNGPSEVAWPSDPHLRGDLFSEWLAQPKHARK